MSVVLTMEDVSMTVLTQEALMSVNAEVVSNSPITGDLVLVCMFKEPS